MSGIFLILTYNHCKNSMIVNHVGLNDIGLKTVL